MAAPTNSGQLPGLESPVDESLRNAVKAGLFTALWPACASVGSMALVWLAQVTSWLATHGVNSGTSDFPKPALLLVAVAGLVVSVAGGIVGGFVRWAQAKGRLPGTPPSYPSSSPGATP